jgi:RNA polymerase sigma factor (sigma-70 family)
MAASHVEGSTDVAESRIAATLSAAAQGDEGAWRSLVDEFFGLVWRVTRSFRLSPCDAADVAQTTWLRLFENIHRIEDPERLGAWLSTTARRECIRVRSRERHDVALSELDDDVDLPDHTAKAVDARLLEREQASEIVAAVRKLPRNWQPIMEMLLVDPPMSYQQIADTLGVPLGSVGPTRGRCIRQLRTLVAM